MDVPYTAHGLSKKYDTALDFHVTMYDALPYRRDSDYCNAEKLTLHSNSIFKYYLCARKEDVFEIDNKDSVIEEILQKLKLRQVAAPAPKVEVIDTPSDPGITPEQIQTLLDDPDEDMISEEATTEVEDNGIDANPDSVNAFADIEDW